MKTPSRHTVALAVAAGAFLVAAGVVGIEGDPDVMALRMVPVIALGGIVAHVATRNRNRTYRWALRLALAATLVLFWAIGAVGVLGPDDEHPADVMYIGWARRSESDPFAARKVIHLGA